MIKTTGSWHTVKDDDQIIQCKIRGKFREKDVRITNPVAVGDFVQYEFDHGESGVITHVEPRKNYIIRRSSNLSKEAHIIAANIDLAFLLITLKMPETPMEFIDRFLMTAEAYHIPVVIIINKMDLLAKDSMALLHSIEQTYQYAGYSCLEISVKTQYGINELVSLMKDKTNLLAGNSGVGKSSLINLICPAVDLKIAEVSSSHKTGKHATTYPEMILLPSGGYIIDTPGIKGFGIIDIEKHEIGLYFNDIFSISRNCSFYNCTHIHEPGCAVMKAVNDKTLAQSRYHSYVNIFSDRNKKYRTG